jgi:ribulose-5-phosphate 4-epimerase/fuculose-1-phosphate aldolase
MSPAEARLKEAPSEMTEAEWSQRVNLAACYRLIAYYGWDDLVDTHISARVPGPEHHFLINPHGLMFDEITASSLVKVDLDGNQLSQSPYSINPAGFTIHSAIHEVREDAGCVIHLHTPDGTAVASCADGLLPLNQTAQLVTFDLAYHDYEGIALDHDERPRLQRDLGDKNHMLLRNHGTLTVGRSVASAFETSSAPAPCRYVPGCWDHQPIPSIPMSSTKTRSCSPIPNGRNCVRPCWCGRRSYASSTGWIPATGIEKLTGPV